MSESVRFIRNLVTINPTGFKKTAVISQPNKELGALKEIAGVDGKITEEDFNQETVSGQKNLDTLLSLEGRHLYINDISHGISLTVKDLSAAMDILQKFKNKLGQTGFEQTVIYLNENWHGSGAYAGDTHAHHLISEGVSFKREEGFDLTPELGDKEDSLTGSVPKITTEVPANLNLTPHSSLALTQRVSVTKELGILKQIASLSGKSDQIEQSDLDSPQFQSLLQKLEGKGLYQNDSGSDALRYDLRRALEALQYIAQKYPGQNLKAIFEEDLLPADQRHVIKKVRVLNESGGYSFEIFPREAEK